MQTLVDAMGRRNQLATPLNLSVQTDVAVGGEFKAFLFDDMKLGTHAVFAEGAKDAVGTEDVQLTVTYEIVLNMQDLQAKL